MKMFQLEDGRNFLRKYRANKEQVNISDADQWFAAIEDRDIIGVVGIDHGKHTSRIKGLYVAPDWRGRGVGTALLARALKDTHTKKVTAFCTRRSEGIFIKQGFCVVREANAHGISFVEKVEV